MIQKNQIVDLIEQNPGLGFAFYQCGIQFSDHFNDSIEGICQARNLNPNWVLQNLKSISSHDPIKILGIPKLLDLILHLKKVHNYFLQEKLPFIFEIIQRSDPKKFDKPQIGRDLKILFPLFYEDFASHIRKEEAEIFSYAISLNGVWEKKGNPGILSYLKPKKDISQMALDHLDEDDEMEGIRKMTHNYSFSSSSSLQQKVVFWELKKFEKDLKRHSHLENKYLFSQVVQLEKKCRLYLIDSFPDN